MVTFGIYNFGMENFWIKYLYDVRSTSRFETKGSVYRTWNKQEGRVKPAGIPLMIAPGKRLGGTASPDWGTAVVQIPWNLYLYYGNTQVLKEFYPDMKRWVNYVDELATDNIVDYGLGDWCPPGIIVPTAIPVKVSSTAFHYLDTKILAQVAALLGYQEDAQYYSGKEKAIRSAFISNFYDTQKKTFGSQTANSMALDFGLNPEGENTAIANEIARNSKEDLDGFMNTGIFGISRLFSALSQNGNEQSAYNILTKKGYNSFDYMWSTYKATTLWEILPVDSFYLKLKNPRSDRSHSHPMQGGYDRWFYQNVLGIKADAKEPGFKLIHLAPEMIQQLQWAKGNYDSPYGLIKSDWQKEGNHFKWSISIPANTKAVLSIPASSKEDVKEGGKPIDNSAFRFIKLENGRALLEAGSGDYVFTSIIQ
jgi:alpha-L-rhamnosidase